MTVEDFTEALRRRREQAANATADLVLDPRDPLPSARTFAERHYTAAGITTLHHHRDAFYSWTGAAYAELPPTALRAEIYKLLERAQRRAGEDGLQPFKPTASKVSDVLDALKAVAHLNPRREPPAWLDDRDQPPPHEIVACRNGLLHLPTRRLLPATPVFFGLNALDLDHDPSAPEPEKWTSFLDTLWPDDPKSIDTLQELFGYFLASSTSQQKAALIVGPKRSGKGTIGRVLKALLGPANVAAPTLSGLAINFGPAQLIGKPLAIISDARLSGRVDQQVIAERLLSISGEDLQTCDRKHREPWTGTLRTRFLVLTNELPRISDPSGALVSRFIVLTLTTSFYGHEDVALTSKLLAELAGILNWAIEGWQRLQDRGRFQQPESSAEAIQELEDLSSPIGAFIRDRCTVEPGRSVRASTLFDAWAAWCEAQGRKHFGTVQSFGRDLRAAVPGLTIGRPRDSDGRTRVYVGIGLG